RGATGPRRSGTARRRSAGPTRPGRVGRGWLEDSPSETVAPWVISPSCSGARPQGPSCWTLLSPNPLQQKKRATNFRLQCQKWHDTTRKPSADLLTRLYEVRCARKLGKGGSDVRRQSGNLSQEPCG